MHGGPVNASRIADRKNRGMPQRRRHDFLVSKMVIRRQQHDDRTRIARGDLQQRQQDAVARAAVLRLHDHILLRQTYHQVLGKDPWLMVVR